MEAGSFSLWREAVNCWSLALSEADDLAVGRGDDDLALGEIEPVDAAVVGADEYAAAGDRRRRVDAGARRERPERLARLRLERVQPLDPRDSSAVRNCRHAAGRQSCR